MSATRKSGGSYRERGTGNTGDILQMVPADFVNSWNFFTLFSQNDHDVYDWCRRNRLLANSFPFPVDNCSGLMTLGALSRAPGGQIFRCSFNRNHTKSSRTYSFERRARASDSFDKLMHELFSASEDSSEEADITMTEDVPAGNLDATSVVVEATQTATRPTTRAKAGNKTQAEVVPIIISDDSDNVQGPLSSTEASCIVTCNPGAASTVLKPGRYAGSTTVNEKKATRMRTDKVCHPHMYREKKTDGSSRTKKRLSNPYAKSAFVWSSDDDDFQ